jgi:hypothetical protein
MSWVHRGMLVRKEAQTPQEAQTGGRRPRVGCGVGIGRRPGRYAPSPSPEWGARHSLLVGWGARHSLLVGWGAGGLGGAAAIAGVLGRAAPLLPPLWPQL